MKPRTYKSFKVPYPASKIIHWKVAPLKTIMTVLLFNKVSSNYLIFIRLEIKLLSNSEHHMQAHLFLLLFILIHARYVEFRRE